MKVLTVEEMVEAEKAADTAGHSYAEMMRLAGQAVADATYQRFPDAIEAGKVLVLVGPGNNGGDGLIAGRYLLGMGAEVEVFLWKPRACDLPLCEELVQGVRSADIVIDALLGTGVSRPIEGDLAEILQTVRDNLHGKVVAVDCPSGLNCDTGVLDPLALRADLTVTFAAAKRGHFLPPGAGSCGKLAIADIGIADKFLDSVQVEMMTEGEAQGVLPVRDFDGHKGTFGAVLVVGGSDAYMGAPILAGMGAYRAGCGLVGLRIPDEARSAVTQLLPEAIFVGDNTPNGRFQSIVIGPGLGGDVELSSFFGQTDLPPLVIDADALNYLAKHEAWWDLIPKPAVLTPHPGEMRRLFGETTHDRIEWARRSAVEAGHVVVLKGAYTVVANPSGFVTVIPIATTVLAVAGSGDVLAGVIGSLIAQGLDVGEAAGLGAYLHARAGQILAQTAGSGHLAREISDAVSLARRQIEGGV